MFKTFGAAILVLGLSGTAHAADQTKLWVSNIGDWTSKSEQTIEIRHTGLSSDKFECYQPTRIKKYMWQMMCKYTENKGGWLTPFTVIIQPLVEYDNTPALYISIVQKSKKVRGDDEDDYVAIDDVFYLRH